MKTNKYEIEYSIKKRAIINYSSTDYDNIAIQNLTYKSIVKADSPQEALNILRQKLTISFEYIIVSIKLIVKL